MKIQAEYPEIIKSALNSLMEFNTTYLWECDFPIYGCCWKTN